MRLSEVAKAIDYGARSRAGSGGVIDDASYNQFAQRHMTRTRRRHNRKTAETAATGGVAGGALGAALNAGKSRRALVRATVGSALGSAGLSGGLHASAASADRRRLRNILSSPNSRYAAERNVVHRMAERTGAKVNEAKWGPASKSDEALVGKPKDKTKEATFGVANNVASALMGSYGAKAVYNQARQKQAEAGRMKPRKTKPAKAPKEPGRIARGAAAMGRKVPAPVKRYAPHAAVAGAVGSQLFNVAGDVQAASYFARDLAANKRGRRIDEKQVAKAYRNYDPEASRRHRLGVYEGAGVTAGAGLMGAGALRARRRSDLSLQRLRAIAGKHKSTGALLASGMALTGGGIAAGRQSRKERNESPWT